MLTKENTYIQAVIHAHTQVESSNTLGLVSISENIKEEYIKLVM